ncbi:MAG: MaoC family dehydratase N-terminal domain-containing protein [Actinomycetota bacterium]|nr:MaoC family dehydratase N-terminal domain-containing protein [Actinomycetota bacterium]
MNELPPAPPPLVVGPLTRTDLVRYQGASGDFQPIHHDEPFARAAGYEAPLSLGMLHAGLLGGWAASWLGAGAVRRFRVRFSEQAFVGDTLTCDGTVSGRRQEGGESMVDLELTCTRQTGQVVARAWASFVCDGQESP